MNQTIQLIKQDALRVKALDCINKLNLPHCDLGAGFVRNLVWDHLHQKPNPTPLNDMDVIYYDAAETDETLYLKYETQLNALLPDVNWQVRNQTKMHIRNGDEPYHDIVDAMSYWPEKETAVAIRKIDHYASENHYECISAFGFESLFNLQVSYNPKRHRDIFETRLQSKQWLTHWPRLKVTVY